MIIFSKQSQSELVNLSSTVVKEYGLNASDFSVQVMADDLKNVSYFVSKSFTFSVGPESVSFAMYLRGKDIFSGKSDLQFNKLIDPNGRVYNLIKGGQECSSVLQYCSVLVPQKKMFDHLTEGEWRFNLVARQTEGLGNPTLSVIQRNDKTLATGVTKITMPVLVHVSDRIGGNVYQGILDSLDRVAAIFSRVGIVFALDETPKIIATSAQVSANFNDYVTSKLVEQGKRDHVNLFFVPEISSLRNMSLHMGVSPGIPGMLGVQSNLNGVLLDTAWMQDSCKTKCGADDARYLAAIITHEIGHFLGLYHTSESNGRKHDPLSDTNECTVEYDDSNFNGIIDADECSDSMNFMFWKNERAMLPTKFSVQQIDVMRASPIMRLKSVF